MAFGTPPAAAPTPPVYNAPNLGPLIDFQLANIPSDSFGKLPVVTTAPFAYYLPLVGDKALFSPINNITSTVRLLQLLDYSQYALAAEAANCGGSMPTEPVSGRYIYMPQGQSASGVRGANLYRYDPWLDAWATMAAISTLVATYRFTYLNGVIWDGGDFVYVFGGYDAVNERATFRYSISGNSWTQLTSSPVGTSGSFAGSCHLVGGDVYLYDGSAELFYKYNLAGDTWTALTGPGVLQATPGLVQDTVNTDLLYMIGGAGAAYVGRYSISGNSWTTLAATNAPGEMQGKGIFIATPTPCILQYRRSSTQMWVYKV